VRRRERTRQIPVSIVGRIAETKSAAQWIVICVDKLVSTIYLGFGYLFVHFLSYVLFFRHVSTLRTEKGILLFHLLSFLLALALAFASCRALEGGTFTAMWAVAAAHSLYSLSFLELWSLAQGSYSLRILSTVGSTPACSPESVIAALSEVGDQKKEQRLSSLQELRLVERVDGYLRLTPRGRVAAIFIRLLRWLANLRETG
jgi:hypothetical protein